MCVQCSFASGKSEPLRAGLLSFIFECGRIRNIATDCGELVRRVYVAVRDEYWNTIPGKILNLRIEKTFSSCLVTFDSRHRKREIDFLWHGRITGSPDGKITFSMEGKALSSFKHKRIGLCVLHAATLCKGKPCNVERVDGWVNQSAFPLFIAPWQPFTNIRSMTYETANGQTAIMHFEGDVFETEDQRNWTDATYKTYAPPIDAAGEEMIEKDTPIRQMLTISVPGPINCQVARFTFPLRLDFRASPLSDRLPELGFTAGLCRELQMEPANSPDSRVERLLRSLPFSHARIDIRPYEKAIKEVAKQAISISKKQVIPIECAIHFSDNADSEARVIAEVFKSAKIPISRFLIYHAKGPAFLEFILPSCAKILRDTFPYAELCAGTNGYFVEINRSRPPLGLVDGICYCATPQVHTFDNIAVMENLPGLLETLTTAHTIASDKNIIVSPLTLRPRKDFLLPLKDGGPDERRGMLFAAAWMLGSIAYCIGGGLNSLTLGDRSGPDGILSDGEEIFPSVVLVSWLAPFLGHAAKCHLSTNSLQVLGIELGASDFFLGIAANCTGEKIAVEFSGLPAQCSYSILDEKVFEHVRRLEDPVKTVPKIPIPDEKKSIRLDLPAYAIIRFSCNC
jgi:hypothetical protein